MLPAEFVAKEWTLKRRTVNETESQRFARRGWEIAGFLGFTPLLQLDAKSIPKSPGVYAVLRTKQSEPEFLAISTGGHFKGKDPTVDIAVLQPNWVPDTDTLYIGKATSLHARLGQYAKFGAGRPIGHWGGRYIWQLADSAEVLACWLPTSDNPAFVESQLIAQFVSLHGMRPFANLRD